MSNLGTVGRSRDLGHLSHVGLLGYPLLVGHWPQRLSATRHIPVNIPDESDTPRLYQLKGEAQGWASRPFTL